MRKIIATFFIFGLLSGCLTVAATSAFASDGGSARGAM